MNIHAVQVDYLSRAAEAAHTIEAKSKTAAVCIIRGEKPNDIESPWIAKTGEAAAASHQSARLATLRIAFTPADACGLVALPGENTPGSLLDPVSKPMALFFWTMYGVYAVRFVISSSTRL